MSCTHPSVHRPTTASRTRGINTTVAGSAYSPRAEDRARSGSLATELLMVIGRDGWFKQLTPSFLDAFGYSEADLLGQRYLTFIHPADRASTCSVLETLSQAEPTLGLENRFRCLDGSYRQLAWTATHGPDGLLYVFARAPTELSLPEEGRVRLLAREQAAALTHNDGFLSSVCHDVQQPLTVILAHTQTLAAAACTWRHVVTRATCDRA